MKVKHLKRLKLIQSEDPIEFERQYNEAMAKLEAFDPEDKLGQIGNAHFAYIRYKEIEEEWDRVSDEFHAEGIRWLCKNCPLHDPEEDKRKMYVWCKYADNGMTHLKHEACEYFYKQVKQGKIIPEE